MLSAMFNLLHKVILLTAILTWSSPLYHIHNHDLPNGMHNYTDAKLWDIIVVSHTSMIFTLYLHYRIITFKLFYEIAL